jgi:subtilisin family serine protease
MVGFESASDLEKVVREIEEAQRAGGITARGARSASLQVDRMGATSIRIRLDFRRGGTKLAGAAELEALRDYARYLSRDTDAAFAHPNWMLDLEGPRTLHLEDLPPEASVQSTGNASISLPSDLSDPTLRSGLLWHYLPPPVGMNAFAAWSTVKGSRDVVVAVLDTGILPDHPGIKGSDNVLAGYNFITDPEVKGGTKDGPEPNATDNGDGCSDILGSTWHGTHVSGTVGAGRTNNGLGVTGVNWAVSVLPIRAMGRCGGRGSIADLASAINWAAGLPVPGVPQNEHKADVINLSIGMQKACEPDEVGVLKQALDDARKAGVIVVAAAGNRKQDAQPVDIKGVTPAGCPGVISVAASDRRGYLTPYSNYGKVSVMAPGGDLDRDDDKDGRPDGVWSFVAPSTEYPSGVAAKEGTSMAAPHVSAAIALALSAKPELRGKPAEIEKLLKRSLAPKPAGACSKPCGPGLLDAKAMVEPEVLTSSTSRSVAKRSRATP